MHTQVQEPLQLDFLPVRFLNSIISFCLLQFPWCFKMAVGISVKLLPQVMPPSLSASHYLPQGGQTPSFISVELSPTPILESLVGGMALGL